MSKYIIKINVGTIEDTNIRTAVEDGTAWLAGMVHAYLVDKANEEFHTRKDAFIKALKVKRVEDGCWGVALDDSANWIIEGSEPHNMLDGFLNSGKAKTGKNGRYLIIPFSHSKDVMTPMQTVLAMAVKSEMSSRHIGMEDSDSSGSEEKYDSFNVDYPATKKDAYDELSDEDRPPWSLKMKKDNPRDPLLHRVKVYDRAAPMGGNVKKEAYTFRTASESQKGTGKWNHPGIQPSEIWSDAQSWAQDKWDNVLLPDILNDLA